MGIKDKELELSVRIRDAKVEEGETKSLEQKFVRINGCFISGRTYVFGFRLSRHN